VWVVRDHRGAPFWILCAMRSAKNAGWTSVLCKECC
jgi:hypothetical protein